MECIYFTITGTRYYYGDSFLKQGDRVRLVKEKENTYDKEAILVKLKGLGAIGYVANSPRTVVGESMSAGRIYDKIEDEAEGEVLYVLPRGVLCRLDERGEETKV